MTLQQLSKTVDFVQATTPSNANDGETYLDTSQSPPQLKVFDGSANAFVRPRSIQNLDAPVSGAGATQTDIEAGAERALEEDIANLTPASNSVAASLDGGVGAVDWASKTPKVETGSAAFSANDDSLVINGSGYLLLVHFRGKNNSDELRFEVDGTQLVVDQRVDESAYVMVDNITDNTTQYAVQFSGPIRFESSVTLGSGSNVPARVFGSVSYVLD